MTIRNASIINILILVISTLSIAQAKADTYSIATTEYTPFTTSKAQHDGFVNRVIREAFNRAGHKVTFNYLPWKRVLKMSADGDFHGASFSFTNAEREKEYLFSDVISEHRELLFHLKSNDIPDWKVIEDLSSFKIGATRSYTYTPEFWEAAKAKRIHIQETSSDLKNFKKLIAKRIDLFPMDEITGWNLLREKLPLGINLLTTHKTPFRSTTGHLIISKKVADHKAIMGEFNKGLQSMKKDGTYDKFLEELFEGKY